MEHVLEQIAAMSRSQYGIVTSAQLGSIGLPASNVSKLVRRGALHRVHPKVFAVGHLALSREARWMAATLGAGEGSALSHHSAAAMWEIVRTTRRDTDVVLARPHRPLAGVKLHQSRTLADGELTTRRGIPVTSVARTLVDLADTTKLETLCNCVHEAAFRELLDLGALEESMARNYTRPGHSRLVAALAAQRSGSAGAMSRLEQRAIDLLRRAGTPAPEVNVVVATPVADLRVDLFWRSCGLVVEIDGPGHTRARTLAEDLWRDEQLAAAGIRVLRATYKEIERQPAAFVAAVVAALRVPTQWSVADRGV